MRLDQLPGWDQENHRAAFAALVQGCGVERSAAMVRACDTARRLGPVSEETARVFLESRFRAQRVGGEGLLTAYFSPEYQARFSSNWEFSVPVRPLPADLEMVDPALVGAPGTAKVAAVRSWGGGNPP
jgi:membrane-bound lytic murein transglycosylase A